MTDDLVFREASLDALLLVGRGLRIGGSLFMVLRYVHSLFAECAVSHMGPRGMKSNLLSYFVSSVSPFSVLTWQLPLVHIL